MGLNFEYLSQGLVLGLVAGILPGPVMMFIFSQVLKKGTLAGIKVQIGASLFDIVRILTTFLLFSYLPQNQILFGLISLVGAIFLLYMAYENFTFKPKLEVSNTDFMHPILQGVLGNILNPHPYIFWLTVGGSIIVTARDNGSIVTAIIFAIGFLIAVFGISAIVAGVAGKLKTYLSSKYYVYTIRVLGLVIVLFAIKLFHLTYQFLFL